MERPGLELGEGRFEERERLERLGVREVRGVEVGVEPERPLAEEERAAGVLPLDAAVGLVGVAGGEVVLLEPADDGVDGAELAADGRLDLIDDLVWRVGPLLPAALAVADGVRERPGPPDVVDPLEGDLVRVLPDERRAREELGARLLAVPVGRAVVLRRRPEVVEERGREGDEPAERVDDDGAGDRPERVGVGERGLGREQPDELDDLAAEGGVGVLPDVALEGGGEGREVEPVPEIDVEGGLGLPALPPAGEAGLLVPVHLGLGLVPICFRVGDRLVERVALGDEGLDGGVPRRLAEPLVVAAERGGGGLGRVVGGLGRLVRLLRGVERFLGRRFLLLDGLVRGVDAVEQPVQRPEKRGEDAGLLLRPLLMGDPDVLAPDDLTSVVVPALVDLEPESEHGPGHAVLLGREDDADGLRGRDGERRRVERPGRVVAERTGGGDVAGKVDREVVATVAERVAGERVGEAVVGSVGERRQRGARRDPVLAEPALRLGREIGDAREVVGLGRLALAGREVLADEALRRDVVVGLGRGRGEEGGDPVAEDVPDGPTVGAELKRLGLFELGADDAGLGVDGVAARAGAGEAERVEGALQQERVVGDLGEVLVLCLRARLEVPDPEASRPVGRGRLNDLEEVEQGRPELDRVGVQADRLEERLGVGPGVAPEVDLGLGDEPRRLGLAEEVGERRERRRGWGVPTVLLGDDALEVDLGLAMLLDECADAVHLEPVAGLHEELDTGTGVEAVGFGDPFVAANGGPVLPTDGLPPEEPVAAVLEVSG